MRSLRRPDPSFSLKHIPLICIFIRNVYLHRTLQLRPLKQPPQAYQNLLNRIITMPLAANHIPADSSSPTSNIWMVYLRCEMDLRWLLRVIVGELHVEGKGTAFVGAVFQTVDRAGPFEDFAVFELYGVAFVYTGRCAQAVEFLLQALFGWRHCGNERVIGLR
jgi:hypothetical protein